jgi:hypothetical protein
MFSWKFGRVQGGTRYLVPVSASSDIRPNQYGIWCIPRYTYCIIGLCSYYCHTQFAFSCRKVLYFPKTLPGNRLAKNLVEYQQKRSNTRTHVSGIRSKCIKCKLFGGQTGFLHGAYTGVLTSCYVTHMFRSVKKWIIFAKTQNVPVLTKKCNVNRGSNFWIFNIFKSYY